MSFEKFQEKSSHSSAFISITSSKSFGFGGDFLKENALTHKDYVELYFDREALKIAFKFTEGQKDQHAFKLISTTSTDSKSAVARSFFTKYLREYDLNEYKNRYQPEKSHDPEHGTLFVIKLEKTVN